MKVLIYSAKDFEIPFLKLANKGAHEITFISERLTTETAFRAIGYRAISIFSADDASYHVLDKLRDFGVEYISLRSAGHDNINSMAAARAKIKVANAPGYSPNAIAEHAITLLLGLNRKLIRSYLQIREQDFRLNNLVGNDLVGKTAGVIGTGRIGKVLCKILHGFGCELLANDLAPDVKLASNFGVRYLELDEVCRKAHLLFLCVPLTDQTYRMIDADRIELMQDSAILVNVARGAVVHTEQLLNALDDNQLGGYATDVYEDEAGIFFYQHSEDKRIDDPLFWRLFDHPKVLLTPHQAFATREALTKIAETTIYNLNCWEEGKDSINNI